MACGDTRLSREGGKVADSLLFLWDRLCQGGALAMAMCDRATQELAVLQLPLQKESLMIQCVMFIATIYSVVPSIMQSHYCNTPKPSLLLQGKCLNVHFTDKEPEAQRSSMTHPNHHSQKAT